MTSRAIDHTSTTAITAATSTDQLRPPRVPRIEPPARWPARPRTRARVDRRVGVALVVGLQQRRGVDAEHPRQRAQVTAGVEVAAARPEVVELDGLDDVGRIRVRSASWSTLRPSRVRAAASTGPTTGSARASRVRPSSITIADRRLGEVAARSSLGAGGVDAVVGRRRPGRWRRPSRSSTTSARRPQAGVAQRSGVPAARVGRGFLDHRLGDAVTHPRPQHDWCRGVGPELDDLGASVVEVDQSVGQLVPVGTDQPRRQRQPHGERTTVDVDDAEPAVPQHRLAREVLDALDLRPGDAVPVAPATHPHPVAVEHHSGARASTSAPRCRSATTAASTQSTQSRTDAGADARMR